MTVHRTLRHLVAAPAATALLALPALVQPSAGSVPAVEAVQGPALRVAAWTPVLRDEFNRANPGGSKWNSGRAGVDITSCGATRPDPSQPGDRVLRVFPQPFATCRITSTDAFGGDGRTYKLSARVKVPTSRGHYTSFWTNSRSGAYDEIDVFESYGRFRPGQYLTCGGGAVARNTTRFRGMQSMVYLDDDPKTGRAHCWTPRQLERLHPFDGAWHTYTAVWNPGESVTFSVDGRRVAQFGPRYAVPSQIDLRLTDIDNNNSERNAQSLKVDWVKVWRR